MIVCFATGPPPPLLLPIVTVPLYAGGVPATAIVQSHAATRQITGANTALTPVEFVIGPVIRINPAVAAAPNTAGVVALAFSAPFNSNFPVEEFATPYAVAFEPPVTDPLTVIVPVPPLLMPYAFAPLPPVTFPFTVQEPAPVTLTPYELNPVPATTFPLTVQDPDVTNTVMAVVDVLFTLPIVADPALTITPFPIPPEFTTPEIVIVPVEPFCDPGPTDPVQLPVMLTVPVELLFMPAEFVEPPPTAFPVMLMVPVLVLLIPCLTDVVLDPLIVRPLPVIVSTFGVVAENAKQVVDPAVI